MSSPFAQKFMGKRPFSDEQYEDLVKKYKEREIKESAETGAPDYELKLKLQKQLAEELAKKKESGDNSPLKGAYASGAGGSEDLLTKIPMMSQAFSNLQGQIMAGFKEQQRKKEQKEKDKQWSKAFKSFGNIDTDLGFEAGKESKDERYGF